MKLSKPMFTISATNDEEDFEQESDREVAIRMMAESNPVGQEARRRLLDTEYAGEVVRLRGTRQQKNNSHRIDVLVGEKTETTYFYNGEGKVTPAQKTVLLEHKYIVV